MKPYPQWRTRPVFVSSTFRDMQAERDYLQFHVFPEVSDHLKARFQHLAPVDFRWGLDPSQAGDEAAWERQVLKVCFGEIGRYRPVVIALLGDRYGQVLPADRIRDAANEAGYSGEVVGKSVTDLEISFAAFRPNAKPCRCRFYFRKPLPYREMDPRDRAKFSDKYSVEPNAGENRRKLVALKKRIYGRYGKLVRRYPAEWNGSGVIGLETWGQWVKQDLIEALDGTADGAPPPAEQAGSWLLQERVRLEHFIEEHSRGFAGRNDQLGTLMRTAKGAEGRPFVCVDGTSGSGKSAVFAKLARLLARDGVWLLAHSTGSGGRSTEVDAMLYRWVDDLRAYLKEPAISPVGSGQADLKRTFAALLNRAAERRRVVCLIDGLDRFERTRAGQYLTWLPALWPDNARLIANTSESTQVELLGLSRNALIVPLEGLDERGAVGMASRICRGYHKDPQAAVIDALLKKNSDKEPVLPLWLKLAMEQLLLLDEDDFEFVDQGGGSRPEKLTQLMLRRVADFPIELDKLHRYDLERTKKTYGNTWTLTVAGLIALSRGGWRQSDLREMFPKAGGSAWNDREFASLRRGFRAHLVQRGPFGQWEFAHAPMRPSITGGGFLDAEAKGSWHREIIRHLESLPREDPIRRSELMYHYVRTKDATAAARYYARIIDDWELDCATRTLAAELISGESETSNSRLGWTLEMLSAVEINMALATSLCTRYLYHLLPALDGLSVRTRLAIVSAVRAQLPKVLEKFPRMPHVERLLAVAHDHLGDLYRESEEWVSARGAFEDGLKIREGLAWGGLGDSNPRLDLSVSHSRLGDINDHLGDAAKATHHYMRDVRLTTELHVSDPSNPDYLRNLSMSHAKLGDLCARVADGKGAEANYAVALTCAESWRAAFPGDPERMHGVSVAQERLARLAAGSGDRRRSLALAYDCLDLRREVYRLDPSSVEHGRGLAVIWDLLAELRAPGAIQYERYAIEIVTGLRRRVPDNRELARDLVLMNGRLEILLEEEKEAGNV